MTEEAKETQKAPAKSSGFVVVNMRKNRVRCAGLTIEPEGKATLTAEQQKDERLMAKVKHGIATGVFSKG